MASSCVGLNVFAADDPLRPAGVPATPHGVESVAYLVERNQARQLVEEKNWVAAEPVLAALSRSYPYDGEVFRDLGRAKFALRRYSEAVDAFTQAYELGLKSYAHDNAADIARSYSLLGDAGNGSRWLGVALFTIHFREPQALIAEPVFDGIRQTPAFRTVVAPLQGTPVAARTVGLQADVEQYMRAFHLYRTDLSARDRSSRPHAASQAEPACPPCRRSMVLSTIPLITCF